MERILDERTRINEATNKAKLKAAMLWQLTNVSAGHLSNATDPRFAEAAALARQAHEHATMMVKLLRAADEAAEKVR